MRKVIFSSFNFAPSFLGPSLNVVQTAIDEGHEVFFITCLKSFKTCGFNPSGLKYMCDLCCFRFGKSEGAVEGKWTTLKLSDLFVEQDFEEARKFMTDHPGVSKSVVYDNYDVGESVLSSYISKTRDRDMELSGSEEALAQLVLQSIVVFRAVKRFLAGNSIDEVLVFNGRWDYYRAVFRAVNQLNIRLNVFENLRQGGIIEFYGNDFPHIIKNKQRKYDQLWADKESLDEKKKIAKDYFQRKRNGEVVLRKSYTDKQDKSRLPENVDGNSRIFSLFNSSDDEFAAVAGDEYRNPYFANQAEGILYVAELVATHLPDVTLVIRMHPNLTGVKFQYVEVLYQLRNKYPNVVLVEPESKVDSYALIDVAEKVISLGSSIAVEANYWRKPVVLLGKPFFFYSDLSYLPRDKPDILNLLKTTLAPKPIENSEKIAYYTMMGGTKARYYNNERNKKYSFKGIRLDVIPFWLKNYLRALKVLRAKN